jgi:hypothetical protein
MANAPRNCEPNCNAIRGVLKRPYDVRLWTRAELLREVERLEEDLEATRAATRETRRALSSIPRWVQWLFQTPKVSKRKHKHKPLTKGDA